MQTLKELSNMVYPLISKDTGNIQGTQELQIDKNTRIFTSEYE